MTHKLNVLVRLDINRTQAIVQINGCLTEANHQALFPLIRRTRSLLADGLAVTVELSAAQHIDVAALHLLDCFAADETAAGGRNITVTAPPVTPICPLLRQEYEALEAVTS
ncbi:hypothetical protein [Arthrobacter sp. AET 35A]|uniref:hypothetical protein n=1 Tax=Arthrobacter sp. AET 35A TaxID=2292643 RepID=UPI0017827C4C|nr:hypothetical protein [Arthrobacter sp. AET 35A]